jgi:hypothetical protein
MIDLLPLDLSIEFYLLSAWRDLVGYRYERDPIEITSGRTDEISDPVPCECTMTLDDRDGSLSPDNPVGAYYGSIGRNNPMRLTNNVARDTFGRIVANGWGSSTTGDAWSIFSTASKYAVTGSAGTHSCSHGDLLTSYLPGVVFANVDLSFTVSLPISNITGDIVWPGGIVLRGQDLNNYIFAAVFIGTDESITITFFDYVAGVYTSIGSSVVIPAVFTGQTLAMRAQVEDETVRMKVWPAASAEPYAWQASGQTLNFRNAGWVGIQSSVAAGNTNTAPIVFSYDNLTVRLPLFAGEVAEWPQSWDLSGEDITTAIVASGIRRRLAQGKSPQTSTLKRGNTTTAPLPVAYWPCEDGKDATTLASGLGGPPMTLAGITELSSYTGFDASAALPVTKAGYWAGEIPGYTATGFIQVRWVMNIPSSEPVDLGILTQLHTTGTSGFWEVKYRVGGGLSLEVWSGGTQILDSGAITFDLIDTDSMISLELTQNGANVDWKLARLEVGQVSGNVASGTLTGRTLGIAARVIVTPYQEVDGVALGHVSVKKAITSLFDLSNELNAWKGELAAARLARLCAQEGIDFSLAGSAAGTAAMGSQLPIALLDLLNECAAADLGTLCEPRGVVGFGYRTGSSLYNQAAVFTLDYSGAQVSDPFKPVIDDQFTRNDITLSRTNGGSVRATLDVGDMSTLPPDQGGVGRADDSPTINVASDDLLAGPAYWLLHLGTVKETRYPSVGVDMRNRHVSSDAALVRAVRDLGVDNRFMIVNPKAGQTPDAITQLARGYSLRLGVLDYFLTINSAPESPYHVAVVGDPAAIIDSDFSTLSIGYSSTAASLSVAVAGEGLWTTSAGDFPFDIKIVGEVIRVTNITGTSSPQTFTVTRSINGVVKSLPAGAPVHVANPVYVGVS